MQTIIENASFIRDICFEYVQLGALILILKFNNIQKIDIIDLAIKATVYYFVLNFTFKYCRDTGNL